jgi:hypothetical protein
MRSVLLLARDPVDAGNDAEVLFQLLDERCHNFLAKDGPTSLPISSDHIPHSAHQKLQNNFQPRQEVQVMTAANGRANGGAGACSTGLDHSALGVASFQTQTLQQFSSEKIKELVAELEIPFEPALVEWRVTNTAQGQSRGQIVPYADQRAYTDRLNALFSPAGWTRKYVVHTSASFERSKDQKLVAKVLVTCELTIFGLGSHSATGEEWADNDNAGTAAEAQAFKRACSCFGLGRYLYHFTGVWVDLDERKRPKNIPQLFGWAAPEGWRQGLRPRQVLTASNSQEVKNGLGVLAGNKELHALVEQIEAMMSIVGRRLYRGVLKAVARVWSPAEIRDLEVLRKVLEQMQAAEQEVRRLDAALNGVEPGILAAILRSLRLNSLDQVESLDTLRKVALAVEGAA